MPEVWNATLGPKFVLLCHPAACRTASYLYAVARHVPILHPKWIADSVRRGIPLGYSEYEVPLGSFLRANVGPIFYWPRTARITSRVFRDVVIWTSIECVQKLVVLMGGHLSNTPNAIVIDDVENRDEDRLVFTDQWVFQCLLYCRTLDIGLHKWFKTCSGPPIVFEEGDVVPRASNGLRVETFTLRKRLYGVGDIVAFGNKQAVFGRILSIEVDDMEPKLVASVEVLVGTGAVLKPKPDVPPVLLDCGDIRHKVAWVTENPEPRSECCSDSVHWRERVYVVQQ